MKYRKKPVVIEAYQTKDPIDIETLEGTMHASSGDYIITIVFNHLLRKHAFQALYLSTTYCDQTVQ